MSIFEELTPELGDIYASATEYQLSTWRQQQQALVTGSGAVSVAIPGLHLAGMGADILFLMNRMAACSYGIGAIVGHQAGKGFILEKEDFAVILGRWSGVDGLSNASIAKTASGAAGHMGGKPLAKILAKTAAKHAGILLTKKAGAKAGLKLGAISSYKIGQKFGSKLVSKSVGGFLPFVGPVIGGGVNLWFITSIADEAESWYRFKLTMDEDDKSVEENND